MQRYLKRSVSSCCERTIDYKFLRIAYIVDQIMLHASLTYCHIMVTTRYRMAERHCTSQLSSVHAR